MNQGCRVACLLSRILPSCALALGISMALSAPTVQAGGTCLFETLPGNGNGGDPDPDPPDPQPDPEPRPPRHPLGGWWGGESIRSVSFAPAAVGITAVGVEAITCGRENQASGHRANAFGQYNNASGDGSSAFGSRNVAGNDGANAYGYGNTASGDRSNAFGFWNEAGGAFANAYGLHNTASGDRSSALGAWNEATGDRSSAFGGWNEAVADHASAFGYNNSASGDRSAAFGYNNIAAGVASGALGVISRATGLRSSAVGYANTAAGDYSSALGTWGHASGTGSLAIGGWYDRNGNGIADLDIDTNGDGVNDARSEAAVATGTSAVAVGAGTVASGNNSSVFGVSSHAVADGSAAIGFEAVAGETGVVSFGHAAGDMRPGGGFFASDRKARLVHVAAGRDQTDAVNVGQLWTLGSDLADRLGGGASYVAGVFTAPTYVVQDVDYHSVGEAISALDGAIATTAAGAVTQQYVDAADAATLQSARDHADAGDAQTLASANAYTDQQVADAGQAALEGAMDYSDQREVAVRGDMATGDARTLSEANQYTDQQVAGAGAMALEEAMSYADGQDAATLGSANAYTDRRMAAWDDRFTHYRQEIDHRFARQDRRIDRVGAMGSAMTHMAVNAALGSGPRGRIAVGVGVQGGQEAVSIGYGRRIGSRASFSLGAAFSHGDSSAGAGFGVDL